jgi:hypothetical protein
MWESFLNFSRSVTEDVTRFDSILMEAPWIQTNLPRYDRWESVRKLSGLLTCPECHASTIRIEALVHIATALAQGNLEPRRDDFVVWFNRHFWNVRLRDMEDPLEDVFISNVIEGSGNHRIFEGIWEQNDYWLQCLLSVSRRLPEKSPYSEMMRSCTAMLDLSDAIAERNGLTRNLEGAGSEKERVFLPSHSELEELADRVVFSMADLFDLQIDPAALAPFVFNDGTSGEILSSTLENSPLERRPILRKGGTFLVALPTAMSIAIRRFILETVEKEGDLTDLDYWLNDLQAKAVVDRGLKRLDSLPWDLVELPEITQRLPFSLTIVPFKFDSDKFGFLCLIVAPLKNAAGSGFASVDDYSERWDSVEEALRRLMEETSEMPEFRAGLLLLVFGGLGAAIAVPQPRLPPKWLMAGYSVPNFLTLAALPDVDVRMIWRLSAQVARAQARGIEFLNPNGDFNLLAAWRKADFALVPHDAPVGEGPLLLEVPINALLDVRLETRIRRDVHAASRVDPPCYLEVERKSANSTFSESRRMPLYVAPSQLVRAGELAGVVEVAWGTWWILNRTQPTTARESRTVFQLWDCFGHWLVPVASKLVELFDRPSFVAEFEVVFSNLGDWMKGGNTELTVVDTPLIWRITELGRANLEVTEQFMGSFAQPLNKAEREIVTALITAGVVLLGETISVSDVEKIRDEILPLGNARYLHFMRVNDASLATGHSPLGAQLVRPEVLAEVRQELGLAIAPGRRGQQTDNPSEVRDQVRAAVAHLKQEISIRLRTLGRVPVVLHCLRVIDFVHRSHHAWKVSAAALFTLNSDRNELLREALEQESQRSGTNIAARALIETAMFECSSEVGDEPPSSTFEELLAMTQEMIRIADYDQPKRMGFPAGKVTVARSGAFNVENEFVDVVRTAYARTSFDDGFHAAAASYGKYFRQRSGQPLPSDFPSFYEACRAEFGLDCEQLLQVGELLNANGAEQEMSVLRMRRSELAVLIECETGISKEASERFLANLRIYPRSAWNADLPPYCERHDVYPWLFKRRFSLLRRPIIEVSLESDPQLIVSPMLVREAVSYLLENSYAGHFPPEFFQTLEMRCFQQAAVDRRSSRFVADTAQAMMQCGFKTRRNVKMTELGGPEELGDIDVLAWRAAPTPLVVIQECKAMRNARSTSEILAQLDQFRGEADDLLAKHQRRLRWLKVNLESLPAITGLSDFAISGAVVTSHRVPMQFVPDSDTTKPVYVDLENLSEVFGGTS